MKPTKTKSALTTAQNEQDAAVYFRAACERIGTAVKPTFIREIGRAYKCDADTAEGMFEAAVKNGDILEAGSGAVKFYKIKEVKI